MLKAQSELRYLKGVGPRRADRLADAGVHTVEDLLYHLPFRYEDRRRYCRIGEMLPGGDPRTLEVRVETSRLIRTRRRGFTIFEAQVSDSSGTIKVVWYNQAYLARVITAGRRMVLYGRTALDRYRRVVFENPDHEMLDEETEGIHAGRIVPVYRKLGDCNTRVLRTMIHRVLADVDPASFAETVPGKIVGRQGFPTRLEALRECHFPAEGSGLVELERRERRSPRNAWPSRRSSCCNSHSGSGDAAGASKHEVSPIGFPTPCGPDWRECCRSG